MTKPADFVRAVRDLSGRHLVPMPGTRLGVSFAGGVKDFGRAARRSQ